MLTNGLLPFINIIMIIIIICIFCWSQNVADVFQSYNVVRSLSPLFKFDLFFFNMCTFLPRFLFWMIAVGLIQTQLII